MRRADRLYELIRILRDGRLHRGADLALRLGVSLRTIYRDVEALAANGLPVEGERGIGYAMTAPITLPPLNLTLEELEALHLGLATVARAADPAIARAARSLAVKVDAVLPEDRAPPARGLGLAVYPFAEPARGFVHMAPLRAAIRSRRLVEIACDGAGEGGETGHLVRPLQLEYWGRIWTLTGWSETAGDFAVFRVDRIRTLDVRFESFDEEPGRRLSDYIDRAG